MEERGKKELVGNEGMVLFEMIRRLAGRGANAHLAVPTNPASLAVCNAPAVLTKAGRRCTAGWYKGESKMVYDNRLLHDLSLGTRNICLAAHVCGRGSVSVGFFKH